VFIVPLILWLYDDGYRHHYGHKTDSVQTFCFLLSKDTKISNISLSATVHSKNIENTRHRFEVRA